jgi:glucosamine-6-phosphate deaminase
VEEAVRGTSTLLKSIHILDGNTKDISKFFAKYERQIRAAGGIDLQVLGIGSDGHIGFNESTLLLPRRPASRR